VTSLLLGWATAGCAYAVMIAGLTACTHYDDVSGFFHTLWSANAAFEGWSQTKYDPPAEDVQGWRRLVKAGLASVSHSVGAMHWWGGVPFSSNSVNRILRLSFLS
jgi:hypothetical protein